MRRWRIWLCTWGTAGWNVCPVGWWDEWPISLSGCAREWGEPEHVPESWHTPVVPSRHPRSCWTPACSRCLCRFDEWKGHKLMLCGCGNVIAPCRESTAPSQLGNTSNKAELGFRTHTHTHSSQSFWPWFCKHGMNTLMLWCNSSPVLSQSHHSSCIQEPITVRMTHWVEKRQKDNQSGKLGGQWWRDNITGRKITGSQLSTNTTNTLSTIL